MPKKKHTSFEWGAQQTVIHYNFPPNMTDDQKREWAEGVAKMILAVKPSDRSQS